MGTEAVAASRQAEQLTPATVLLQLERSARHAVDLEALRFVIVNETRRLFEYRQAVLAAGVGTEAVVAAVSSVAQLEKDAPFVRWMERVLRQVSEPAAQAVQLLGPEQVADGERGDWVEFAARHVMLCRLQAPDGTTLGVLWLARDKPWQEAEQVLVERLMDAYAHAWWALLGKRGARRKRHRYGRWAVAALLSAVVLMFVPVSQSVLAPAEVVARDPVMVTTPMDGVIAKVLVDPNQAVHKGQPLFRFEDVDLRSRVDVAEKTLAVADAELRTASQGAFQDPRSNARLALLKSQVDLRAAELKYAREMLDRVTVSAEQDGIVVFTDANDWEGRPVSVGERVMQLADPKQVELQVDLPVEDAIVLDMGAPVRVFLDFDPLHPLPASLTHASYEASVNARKVLAYRLKAQFPPQVSAPRIGLQGTAKVYGEDVPLFYYLFRRPIAVMRQSLGL